MTRLMRTSEITKLPVVTFAGEDVAQIKDIVYAANGGAVDGFTLAGRGIFAGPLKQGLAWPAIAALGADAVMIKDESALSSTKEVLAGSAASGGSGANVLGSQVLTDSGKELGTVVDVVIEFDHVEGVSCDVIGYEIEAAEDLRSKGTRLLVPLPDTLSVSGEHLMVPASAEQFVGRDLAGFGAAVAAFRAQLKGND